MEQSTDSGGALEKKWVKQIVGAIRVAEDSGTPTIDFGGLRQARSQLEGAVLRAMIAEFNARVLAEGRIPTQITPMTARILRLLEASARNAGFRVTAIARELKVSVSTVERLHGPVTRAADSHLRSEAVAHGYHSVHKGDRDHGWLWQRVGDGRTLPIGDGSHAKGLQAGEGMNVV